MQGRRAAAWSPRAGMSSLATDLMIEPSDAEIRAMLERVVASASFSKSPQLVSFLRFVVETVLAGHGRQIKGYTIATDALGRDARFNPQTDPIVRVEAGRLRRALDHYYANEGRLDPTVIEMPRGGYVPAFRANAVPRGAGGDGPRRQIAGMLHGNARLILLVAIVATIVSLSFDLLEVALAKEIRSSIAVTQQAPSQPLAALDLHASLIP